MGSSSVKPVKVGICGLGTVGGGTLNVLQRNAEEISRRAGRGIEVAQIAMRTPKPQYQTTGIAITNDVFDVATNPEIDIVIELVGGYTVARELVLKAIENGKHVVTANKALIAVHGNEIFAKAREKGVIVAFEAAVAGGIPVIKAIREGLSANRINWVAGIINGTGNFILTEMREKGRTFEDVLAEAQALGYAEALGYRIKHLGVARSTAAGIELRVHPTLIPADRLIANVNGVMNAVMVNGDAAGSTLFYGAGAGMEPTASSVIADLVDVVRAMTSDPENRVPHLAFQPDSLSAHPILPIEACESSYYLRIQAKDHPGVLAQVASILSERGINIESIMQKEVEEHDGLVPMILLTHRVLEQHMNDAIAALEALQGVVGPVVRIRVEHLN
jgi:homoserine dehydrogenase